MSMDGRFPRSGFKASVGPLRLGCKFFLNSADMKGPTGILDEMGVRSSNAAGPDIAKSADFCVAKCAKHTARRFLTLRLRPPAVGEDRFSQCRLPVRYLVLGVILHHRRRPRHDPGEYFS